MTAGMTRRILKRYDAATADQLAAGHDWYQRAQDAARSMTCDQVSFEQAAYVIAALSPQVSWDKNLDAATRLLYSYRAGTFDGETLANYPGYGANVRKCAEILAGNLDALKGPKVTAFALAILGDLSLVVVDVWAIRAARDSRTNTAFAYLDDELPGARERRTIEQAYRNAARLRSVEPSVMQAVVWTQCREDTCWRKPQTLPHAERRRYYARQAAARARIGKGMPYSWQDVAPMREQAYA